MKRTLLILSLASGLTAGTAHAEPFFSSNTEGNCQFLAEMAHHFASNRETHTREEAQQVIFNTSTKNQDIISDVLHVVDIVYMYPRKSPSVEGNVVFGLCREE